MDIFLNILITIFVSILTCIIYDFIKSYLLSKKLKDLSNNSNTDSWVEFWNNNFPDYNDFIDKEEK